MNIRIRVFMCTYTLIVCAMGCRVIGTIHMYMYHTTGAPTAAQANGGEANTSELL